MESEYTADSIEVITWPAAARKRPGMYIGATDDGAGPLHLLLAIVANAIDQILLARCAHVDVRVDADDFVTVTDDGPGIPARSLVELLEQPSKPRPATRTACTSASDSVAQACRSSTR
ncbi:ATP-binding protein [Nannocystis pusilla]|uniref:ATP-binding protein n=1 Tax=Nannocystis pusilla TaxID=889268 RepID=UPI003B76DAD7